jgi:putative serine protease PepD
MLVGVGAFVVGLRERVVAEHEAPTADLNPIDSDGFLSFGGLNGIGGPSVSDRADKVASSIVAVEGEGTGSGVVVSSDGVVITSAEVVGNLSEVQVTFADGSTAFATMLGTDPTTRVAVLDVPDHDLDSARLVAPDASSLGKVVVLAGMDVDGDLRTTVGKLRKGEPDPSLGEEPSEMLELDADEDDLADLEGAAVIDASGSVLGLATWSDDGSFYVAPIDVARGVAADLLRLGPTSD